MEDPKNNLAVLKLIDWIQALYQALRPVATIVISILVIFSVRSTGAFLSEIMRKAIDAMIDSQSPCLALLNVSIIFGIVIVVIGVVYMLCRRFSPRC